MRIYRVLAPICVMAGLVVGGCTHDELKVAPAGHVSASNTVNAGSANNQVAAAEGPLAVNTTQAAPMNDTLLTPERSGWRPRMPMVLPGSCPGEDCEYGYLVKACEDLMMSTTDSSDGKPSGLTLHRGDTATLVTGNLHLIEPGIVLMKRDYSITDNVDAESDYKSPRPDTLRFFAGDTVYVLDYVELGSWNWWYRGKHGSGNEFWTGVLQRSHNRDDGQRPAVSISRPRGEWWYKLQLDTRNDGGWVRSASGWWVDLKFVRLDSDWKCGGRGGHSDLSATQ